MSEVWLRSNRRVLILAMVPVAALGLLGLAFSMSGGSSLTWGLGIVCLAVAGMLLAGLAYQWIQPRITYRNGQVLFFLKAGGPIVVPVQVVEAFFLGQGPAELPVSNDNQTKTVNLIARLSQRHPQWLCRDVKQALGEWSEGYITIRGIWCEPLTSETIRRLNHRLHEVLQEQSEG